MLQCCLSSLPELWTCSNGFGLHCWSITQHFGLSATCTVKKSSSDGSAVWALLLTWFKHRFNKAPVSCLSPSQATLLQPSAYGSTAAPQQWLFTDDQTLPRGAQANTASICTVCFFIKLISFFPLLMMPTTSWQGFPLSVWNLSVLILQYLLICHIMLLSFLAL